MGHQIGIRVAVAGEQTILATLSARVQGLHVRERPEVFKPVDLPGLERWFADALTSWTFNNVAQLAFERLGFVAKNLRFVRRIDAGEAECRPGNRSGGPG